ncbi:hypothetical protein NKH69_25880 [Mesorhizobium sp. M0976]
MSEIKAVTRKTFDFFAEGTMPRRELAALENS